MPSVKDNRGKEEEGADVSQLLGAGERERGGGTICMREKMGWVGEGRGSLCPRPSSSTLGMGIKEKMWEETFPLKS